VQTFTGLEYLKIDIASSFGLDKKTWAERLAWFEVNQGSLHAQIKQAKDPALYFAGVMAYEATMRGEPSGYPISLDATSSGLQILAALTCDRGGASLCNVVNTGQRENAYELVCQLMGQRVGPEMAKNINPEDAKQAIMTALYSSEKVPKEVFGDLYDTFVETMEDEAPGVWTLNKEFLKLWNPNALSNDWVLPDNFHVHVKVMNTVPMNVTFLDEPYTAFRKVNEPMEEGRSLGANVTHSIDGMIVREMLRRCKFDVVNIGYLRKLLEGEWVCKDNTEHHLKMVKILWGHYERTGFLSTRILEHLDSYTLHVVDIDTIRWTMNRLPAKPFNILTTHDCFKVLPNYGNDLRRQYNNLLEEIARSNLLGDILTQLTGDQWDSFKLDPTLADDIVNAEYALS